MNYDLSLVTRAGCHLCMDMEARLEIYAEQYEIPYVIKDVDESPELLARFNHDVPVLLKQDEVVCMHFFDEKKISRALNQ